MLRAQGQQLLAVHVHAFAPSVHWAFSVIIRLGSNLYGIATKNSSDTYVCFCALKAKAFAFVCS